MTTFFDLDDADSLEISPSSIALLMFSPRGIKHREAASSSLTMFNQAQMNNGWVIVLQIHVQTESPHYYYYYVLAADKTRIRSDETLLFWTLDQCWKPASTLKHIFRVFVSPCDDVNGTMSKKEGHIRSSNTFSIDRRLQTREISDRHMTIKYLLIVGVDLSSNRIGCDVFFLSVRSSCLICSDWEERKRDTYTFMT